MNKLPFAYWILGMQTARMIVEAHSVVGFRILGAMGGWPVKPSENLRMVNEKAPAFMRAYRDATAAVLKGKRPDQIATAALRPIGRKTRANAKRLARAT